MIKNKNFTNFVEEIFNSYQVKLAKKFLITVPSLHKCYNCTCSDGYEGQPPDTNRR